jgi:hypothetical protein
MYWWFHWGNAARGVKLIADPQLLSVPQFKTLAGIRCGG